MHIYTSDVYAELQKTNPKIVGTDKFDLETIIVAVNKIIERRETYEQDKQKVNGWEGNGDKSSAWATWTASMNFDGPGDDEALYDIIKEHGPGVSYEMAEAVEEYLTQYITGEEWSDAFKNLPPLGRDFLTATINEINWYELCENWIEEVDFEACEVCGDIGCSGVSDRTECPSYEECEICGDWECPSLESLDDTDCPEYEDPEDIDPSDGMFVDADGVEGQLSVEEILAERMQSISEQLIFKSLELGPIASMPDEDKQADEQFKLMRSIYWPEDDPDKDLSEEEDDDNTGSDSVVP
jgi:hypothetical protein